MTQKVFYFRKLLLFLKKAEFN